VGNTENAQNIRVDRHAEPGGPAVLLVEDNEVNQAVAAAMLRGRGYQVDVVENGREALDAVERKPYVAVLMDCQMPVMDGYEATAELRRRESADEHLPVIALTAHAFDGERCQAAGMDGFLAKPVRADQLAAALERHTGQMISRTTLATLREAVGGQERLDRILDVFVSQAETHIETIAHAIALGDAGAVARTAHTLKGGAAAIGACGMAAIAGTLERMGETRDLAAAPDETRRLSEAYERTRAELATL
jgi:two-component system, sensor histidine kinase and response regulator